VLRRVENVAVRPRGILGSTSIIIGRKTYRIRGMSWRRYRKLAVDQRESPQHICTIGERRYWLFRSRWYWENQGLRHDAVRALLLDQERRQARRIDRAQLLTTTDDSLRPTLRESIPPDIRTYVWQRDGAQCTRCGAKQFLEFDHIVPLAMGGSNSARNLQLLCETCNREKGGHLA
jgi:5-methylcytosine-specific restriction endonuclease McrA